MKTNFLLIALASSGIACFATAQSDTTAVDGKASPKSGHTTPDYVLLNDIIGANVAIVAGAEARREAAEDNKAAKLEKAEIEDVLLDQQSGVLDCAVISFGGILGLRDKTVALPIGLLTWNATSKHYDAAVDIDQLNALPAFDLEAACKNGLDRELLNLRTAWTKANLREVQSTRDHGTADASAKREVEKAEDGKNVGLAAAPIRCVAGSKIDDPAVYAANGTDKFGKVSNVIVDRNACCLAFYVVSHGGALGVGDTEYLVPREALTLSQKGNDTFYCVNRSVEDMKASGIRYEKPKNGVLDESVAERARQQISRR